MYFECFEEPEMLILGPAASLVRTTPTQLHEGRENLWCHCGLFLQLNVCNIDLSELSDNFVLLKNLGGLLFF